MDIAGSLDRVSLEKHQISSARPISPFALGPEHTHEWTREGSSVVRRVRYSSAVMKLRIDEDLLLIGSVFALAAVALMLFWLLF